MIGLTTILAFCWGRPIEKEAVPMPVDKEITDPAELAAFIEKNLQPGNTPGYPWVSFQLSNAEWDLIIATLKEVKL